MTARPGAFSKLSTKLRPWGLYEHFSIQWWICGLGILVVEIQYKLMTFKTSVVQDTFSSGYVDWQGRRRQNMKPSNQNPARSQYSVSNEIPDKKR